MQTYQCSHQWRIQTLSYGKGGGGGPVLFGLLCWLFVLLLFLLFLPKIRGEGSGDPPPRSANYEEPC